MFRTNERGAEALLESPSHAAGVKCDSIIYFELCKRVFSLGILFYFCISQLKRTNMSRQCVHFSAQEDAYILSPNFNINIFLQRWPSRPRKTVWDRMSYLRKKGHTVAGKKYDDSKKNKDYQEAHCKNFVQEKIFSQCAGIVSDILCLLGPTSDRYLEQLRRHVTYNKHRIVSHELKEKVYQKQYKKFILGNIEDVYIRNTNVFNSPFIPNYIDLDLMCTWDTIKEQLITLFDKQVLKYEKYRFAFNFTLSLRAKKKEEWTKIVENIFSEITNHPCRVSKIAECEVEGTKKKVLKYTINANVSCDLVAYYYCDTTPMISFSISK